MHLKLVVCINVPKKPLFSILKNSKYKFYKAYFKEITMTT